MKKNIVKFYDLTSIAVINPAGKIRVLYCPFRVKCIWSIEEISNNTFVYVEEVFQDNNFQILYKVGGKIYCHKHFILNINY